MEENSWEVHCSEVYGGNTRVDQGLQLPDLDAWLFSRPHGGGAEGGDVVFLSVCDVGSMSKAYLGDVAGHGEQVAPIARELEALVREHLNDHDHQAFFHALNDEADGGSFEGRFATMVAVTYDRVRGRLVYAYAGHPKLLLKPSGADSFSSLEPDYCPVPGALADLAIGVIPGTRYFQSAAPFEVGDLAVLYSDGWLETRLPGGERPGLDGLISVADRCSVRSAAAFREDLERRYRDELGVASFEDDLSLVVLVRTR